MSTVKTSLSSGRKRKRGNFAHSLLGRQIEGGHGRKKREALRPVGVPGRLRVKLQSILDTEGEIKKSVVLAFSVCGNFLISYRAYRTAAETRYCLQWWIFSFEAPVVKAAEVELFRGLKDSSSSIKEAFGPDGDHLRIQVAQAPDSSSIAVTAHTEESRDRESRINLLSILPVPCATNPRRGSGFCSLEISFVSYRPHEILDPRSLVTDDSRYHLVVNALTGLHLICFAVRGIPPSPSKEREEKANIPPFTFSSQSKEIPSDPGEISSNSPNISRNLPEISRKPLEISRNISHSMEEREEKQVIITKEDMKTTNSKGEEGHSGSRGGTCFSFGSSTWALRAMATIHYKDSAPMTVKVENWVLPKKFRGYGGIYILSQSSVDIEAHLLHKVRQNSRKLPSPKSLSIHNYEIKILSAGVLRRVSAEEFHEITMKLRKKPASETSDKGSGLVTPVVINHRLPPSRPGRHSCNSPEREQRGRGKNLAFPQRKSWRYFNGLRILCILMLELSVRKSPSGPQMLSSQVFRMGLDWATQSIVDLKMRKINLNQLHQKNPNHSRMSICCAVASRCPTRLSGWDFNATSEKGGMILSTNAAVFQGTPVRYIRHPRLPLALLFT